TLQLCSGLYSVAQLGEQPNDFQVQPDQRDHQAEGSVPLHIFWSAGANASLNKVEVKDEVERRYCDHHHAESNADGSRSIDRPKVDAEEAKNDFGKIEQHDGSGRGENPHPQLL